MAFQRGQVGPGFKHFTGYEGLFCGFSAIYTGLAQVLNEVSGKNSDAAGPGEEMIFRKVMRCASHAVPKSKSTAAAAGVRGAVGQTAGGGFVLSLVVRAVRA